jgi:hypothetical protein
MGNKNITTPGNIKYGDMPADYRMKYKQMIEKHNNQEKEKKNKKSKLEQFADKLYGGKK